MCNVSRPANGYKWLTTTGYSLTTVQGWLKAKLDVRGKGVPCNLLNFLLASLGIQAQQLVYIARHLLQQGYQIHLEHSKHQCGATLVLLALEVSNGYVDCMTSMPPSTKLHVGLPAASKV